MIVANLATYPARRARLAEVVRSIIGQVDRLNVVFNQYDAIPDEFRGIFGLNAVIPEEDTRDAGKFYVDVTGAEWVFYIDDDIVYPPDYVASSLECIGTLPIKDGLFGYHGSIYHEPVRKFGFSAKALRALMASKARLIQNSRKNFRFDRPLDRAVLVDQIATNSAVMRGRQVTPFEFMKDSQRFVDVRLARWCHGRGLPMVCLPHEREWLTSIRYEETIYQGFTRLSHSHLGKEILTYASTDPRVGTTVTNRDGWN